MKKQLEIHSTRPLTRRYEVTLPLIPLAAVVVAVGVIAAILFTWSSNAAAQDETVVMQGSERYRFVCDGRRFKVVRYSSKEYLLHCIPLVDATPTPEPIEPTTPPVEPTVAPTQPPVEPTAAPIVPTEPPVQPTVAPIVPTVAPPDAGSGHFFYVSKLGNNGDGRSWATAWNELDQVNWSQFQPGDTLLIDGGTNQMTYGKTLRPTVSGTAEKPIRIRLASEAGRNGQVVIFGGRSTPLPYCYQPDYPVDTSSVLSNGALFDGVSHIVLDGMKWRGIVIHGMDGDGIRLYEDTSNLTFRHLEIYDNGTVRTSSSGGYKSDGKGLRLEGANHLVERTLIHDNGQDAIQSDGDGVSNFTVRQSWFYNGRKHPSVNESFNYCSHSDAVQIFDGGVVRGVTIEDSIMGPGFTNTLLLGDRNVDVVDVLIRNVLFLKGAENNISAHSSATTSVKNWRIENVTVHAPNTVYNSIYYKGSELHIRDSIFVGSQINIPNTTPNVSNNCQWQTTGKDIGVETQIQFASATTNPFDLGTYSVTSGGQACPGAGATITSVEQLMALPPTE